MKPSFRLALWALIGLVLASGCSVFPGLKALSSQAGADAAADTLVQTTSLVMGDKTGLTDPALNAIADRIEAANGRNADVIEIRRDLNTKVFSVYMLIVPQSQGMTNTEFLDQERRAVELTWQGILDQSQGSNILKVVTLIPGSVSTLDKGIGFVGIVNHEYEIPRADAILYLNRSSKSFNDFVDLVVKGTLSATVPPEITYYEGIPNHPSFILSALKAQLQPEN